MSIPKGFHESGYTRGELKALVAPTLGCKPEDLGDVVIVAYGTDENIVGVHTTISCSNRIHWQTRAQCLLADGIRSFATSIYDETLQHGPGEH